MLSRRDLLAQSLKGSTLLAFGNIVPQFVAETAHAAAGPRRRDSDTVLVVVEMTGGNDGLNTVIPYADDLYQKARPTLRFTKEQVVKLDDHVGLHPGMRSLEGMFKDGHLAVIQGVGYPNPDRSHFESMDVWHSGDPRRKITNGWLGRSAAMLQSRKGAIPLLSMGGQRVPMALTGTPGTALSISDPNAFRLDLGGGSDQRHTARRKLLDDLAAPTKEADPLLSFVRRRQLHTYASVENLRRELDNFRSEDGVYVEKARRFYGRNSLPQKLQLLARLISRRMGTRVFYVSIGGFDTHSAQGPAHEKLLAEVADGIFQFFKNLKGTKDDGRVRLLTFSEFGRRVRENGSKGTDHGAGSCLFVAGPSVRGGVVGKHPSLEDLDSGDLKYHTDFRRVYASLLTNWLGCDSKAALGAIFEPIPALKHRV
jgi:uncharacterized protein (DUF1501 family)